MPEGVDDLDGGALEIATKYLLDRWTLKQLASMYHRSPATLHRRLTKWLDSGRFELTDTQTAESIPRVVGIDERLSEALSGRTHIWRAHVAVVEGVGDAYSGNYLMPNDSAEAQRAFEAHDRLHQALGQAASSYFASRLRRGMTIGVSSGRGGSLDASAASPSRSYQQSSDLVLQHLVARQPYGVEDSPLAPGTQYAPSGLARLCGIGPDGQPGARPGGEAPRSET